MPRPEAPADKRLDEPKLRAAERPPSTQPAPSGASPAAAAGAESLAKAGPGAGAASVPDAAAAPSEFVAMLTIDSVRNGTAFRGSSGRGGSPKDKDKDKDAAGPGGGRGAPAPTGEEKEGAKAGDKAGEASQGNPLVSGFRADPSLRDRAATPEQVLRDELQQFLRGQMERDATAVPTTWSGGSLRVSTFVPPPDARAKDAGAADAPTGARGESIDRWWLVEGTQAELTMLLVEARRFVDAAHHRLQTGEIPLPRATANEQPKARADADTGTPDPGRARAPEPPAAGDARWGALDDLRQRASGERRRMVLHFRVRG